MVTVTPQQSCAMRLSMFKLYHNITLLELQAGVTVYAFNDLKLNVHVVYFFMSFKSI